MSDIAIDSFRRLLFFLDLKPHLCYNFHMFNERETLRVNEKGHLEIGGADCVELASHFSTPLYVYDEAYIRKMMRVYRQTFEEEYGGRGLVLYASKAFSCVAMYAIAAQEGIGADVVSGGELYTAMQANFPPEHIYMHGNNKLPSELDAALDAKVGCIVVDSKEEAEYLDAAAESRGIVQNVMLRINPGVEAHTHSFVQTATPDSKFGFSVHDGSAEEMTAFLLNRKNLRLIGYHSHIGSQIFEKNSFVLAVERVLAFAATIRNKYGFEPKSVNMGGGFGIWYTDEDRKIAPEGYREYLSALISAVKTNCHKYGLSLPQLLIEPGRSIVGEAGITLYTVGTVKEIKGLKTYVAIDGGMFDNPRYALYRSKYTAVLANRMHDPCTELVSVAGKCCESGDLIGVNMDLPKAKRGDILAVLSTGAYNYSMASNYNRNLIPPAILVKDGKAEYIIRPQTYSDLVRSDVLPDRLK